MSSTMPVESSINNSSNNSNKPSACIDIKNHSNLEVRNQTQLDRLLPFCYLAPIWTNHFRENTLELGRGQTIRVLATMNHPQIIINNGKNLQQSQKVNYEYKIIILSNSEHPLSLPFYLQLSHFRVELTTITLDYH